LPNRPGGFPSVDCSWVEGMLVTVGLDGSDRCTSKALEKEEDSRAQKPFIGILRINESCPAVPG
jgi:hypothetical protein